LGVLGPLLFCAQSDELCCIVTQAQVFLEMLIKHRFATRAEIASGLPAASRPKLTPPVWYKSAPYRSRAVIDPRGVLLEFGLQLPDDVELRVWDSTAEIFRAFCCAGVMGRASIRAGLRVRGYVGGLP
jgi:hypothetical protein